MSFAEYRQTKTNTVLSVSRAIACTGVEVDYRRSSQPLIASLRSQGLIRPNQLGLGLDTTSNGAVLDAIGTVSTLYNKGRTVSTIGEEKRLNPRFVDRTREQFVTLMSHLGLDYPKKMKEAVPANEYCGDFIPQASLDTVMNSTVSDDREKLEQMLSANTEIYNDYFAMYI